jgi:ferredoxin
MKTRVNDRGRATTKYIQLNTRKCKACWKCVEICDKNVIGRINLPWHKHAVIVRSNNCAGCLKCMKACEHNAISKIQTTELNDNSRKGRPASRFLVNFGLLLIGFFVVFSGFLIQFNYHVGHHGMIDMDKMVSGISYSAWTMIHKISIILISFLVVCHIGQHWKWYRTIVIKRLIAKNKQVITLSVIFLIVALTGYLSWFIDFAGNAPIVRKTFLEIHDKIAIVFFIFLFLHVAKRLKWFFRFTKGGK